MNRAKTRLVLSAFFVAVFLSSTYVALNLNTDFGKLEAKTIKIIDNNRELSGLMYRPTSSSTQDLFPSIVLAHGISESKEMMSNLGLELARRGFIVLCLDLPGHGNSDGKIEQASSEPDLGVQSAIDYLISSPNVNSSAIGLVGHSLGAGAVRAADAKNPQISATVLIGGGVGTAAQDPQYGVLNTTSPKNLLVIVGQYDVLFNLTDLTTNQLPVIFNSNLPIEANILYGSFQTQTARKLVTPSTTHLFETVDSTVIRETTLWMENALKTTQSSDQTSKTDMIYSVRETAILIALIGLLGTIFLSYYPIAKAFSSKPKEETAANDNKPFKKLKAYAVWGTLNLALFFPMIAVGTVISFPPLIFGASIAWWAIATGIAGILVISKNRPHLNEKRINLKTTLRNAFDRREILTAIILFLLMFTVSSTLQELFGINLRILAPIFQELSSTRRILAFLSFIPFFLTYFVGESLYFHGFIGPVKETRNWTRNNRLRESGFRQNRSLLVSNRPAVLAQIPLQLLDLAQLCWLHRRIPLANSANFHHNICKLLVVLQNHS